MLNLHKETSAADVCESRKEVRMNNKITILYERLSVDDGNSGESNSIQNQRRILEEYAVQHGMTPFVHYCDDGISGTRWDRAGWMKVMDEIESGNVANLIVKNLDRMGRDYLRVGLHMERFRELGVRFIAVGDSIDTADGEDDFAPFRAIFAEWYARDCSRKVKSVLHARGKSGKPTSNVPPYGYMKNPDDKNHWIVDPEAAAVVRRIFEMTIDGMGPRVIANKLYEEKIERPSYYMAQRGYGNYIKNCDKENPYAWCNTSVAHILERLDYAGHTVNFKGATPSFKSRKRVENPREDWLIFRDTHEAIITEQQWELVQKLRQTKRRTDTLGEANPLTGLLFCGECGAKMYNARSAKTRTHKKGDKEYVYKTQHSQYYCSTYTLTRIKHNRKCTAHIIQSHVVEQIILELLRDTNGYIREHEKEFIAHLQEKSALQKGESAKLHKKQIAKNEKRIAELEKIYRKLYEDLALGRIEQSRFDEMSAGYIGEQSDLKNQTSAMQADLDSFNSDTANVEKFVELVKRFTDFSELTPAMLHEFVDRVIVHEGEWSGGVNPETGRPRGKRSQKIEVYLKYIGSFDNPNAPTAEEIEAEQLAIEQERRERKRQYMRQYLREWRLRQKEKAKVEKEIS